MAPKGGEMRHNKRKARAILGSIAHWTGVAVVVIVVIVVIVFVVELVTLLDQPRQRDQRCYDAGYTDCVGSGPYYCVKIVDGTEVMAPLDEVGQ